MRFPQTLWQLKLPPADVEAECLQELALALYQRRVLSSGKAQKPAQMTRWEFEELLGQRRIPRHYSEEDLEDDVAYGRRRL